ncbi:MAG: coniferyl aldehyde dehydrogenase [Sandaracinaceae bacterium]|nr:coniferyl aldehyde dehydrogenase [Sandaracinaceae bacterium]
MTTTTTETTGRAARPNANDPRAALARLRAGFERDPNPSIEARRRHLDALERMVMRHKDAITRAITADFGGRSAHETLIAEIFLTVEGVRYAKANLAKWMAPERRKPGLAYQPAKVSVHYQPKGVVGIISPWNYPVQLALAPLTGALAAGNRALLKPSELTPETSALLSRIVADTFSDDLVSVVTGGVQLAVDFSHLSFDHLVFTGSTHVGRLVMKAAADNLVPVTLELGGKSPTILHDSYPLEKAAETIALGKWFNAGQTCIAPDYLLVPEGRVEPLIRALEAAIRKSYPTLRDNPDYTSIVNTRHRERLGALLADAGDKGARVIEVNPAGERFEGTNKLPPTLVTQVDDGMLLMQEEIFGPVLPIVPYARLEDALRYVAERPRPLALYYFDDDARRVERVIERSLSGGVAINACLLQCCVDDAPFGGIGPSGMGAYHGHEGFLTFSHAKTVFHQAKLNAAPLLAPPYGRAIEVLMKLLLRG